MVVPVLAMHTHAIVLYQHTIHIQLYSIDQSEPPVAESYHKEETQRAIHDAVVKRCRLTPRVESSRFQLLESTSLSKPLVGVSNINLRPYTVVAAVERGEIPRKTVLAAARRVVGARCKLDLRF